MTLSNEFGADTMRLYEMFIGDFEKAAPWNPASIRGCRRFVERFWNFQNILTEGGRCARSWRPPSTRPSTKVGEDIENLKFNTAIAALMSLMNEIYDTGSITKEELRLFALLLDPFAPHVVDELWEAVGYGNGMACQQAWPAYDEAKCRDNTVEIAVQVNGKVRARIQVAADSAKEDILAAAKAEEKIAAELNGKQIVKEICVPGKLVNIVVKK